ncbi:MAG: hypothetical protein ACLRH1_12000 [Acutalibacteraceae bacterium]
MSNRKPIRELVENVKLGNYALSSVDLDEIFSITIHDSFKGLITAYEYGFIKGQRASAAKARRARKEANA